MGVLLDGFKTLITFATSGFTLVFEKTVTPPGMDAGGPIDVATMQTTLWRPRVAKSLITLTECTFMAAYDVGGFSEALTALGVNQLITITFTGDRVASDTLQFYGWVDKFIPNENKEGEQPTVTVTVCPSNLNTSYVETAPVITTS